jgi:hypothetical protein
MPTPQFAFRAGLGTFLLGLALAVANIMLGHGTLANLCFGLAVVCDLAFTGFAILWVMSRGWTAQPQMQGRPPGMPGMPGLPPGMVIKGMPQNPKPGAQVAPTQAQRPPQP